jgi:carbonic anhydrase
VLRNAGGIVTDDVIRSLALSQRLLGTTEIALVHHTDCGLQKVQDDEFVEQLETETGERPSWVPGAFSDPYEDVLRSMERLAASPFVPHRDKIRGYVYDVESGDFTPVVR